MGGKKKGRRQSDPSREEAESTDEENIPEVENSACPHTGKAVALTAIKKNLKISFVKVGQCAPCLKVKKLQGRPPPPVRGPAGGKKTLAEQRREQLERARQEQIAAAAKLKALKAASTPAVATATQAAAKETETAEAKDKKTEPKVVAPITPTGPIVVWLCLKCGSQCCGKEYKNHCEEHAKTPRSDLHCLYLNTDTWQIYCWECDKDIYVDSHKKLYEAVEFVKKVNEKPNKQNVKTLTRLTGKEAKDTGNSASSAQSGVLPKVKGLTNLGNTCFFNSVMQCLSQTHPLTQLIDQQTSKGANLNLNILDEGEVELSEDENENIVDSSWQNLLVPELSLHLPEGGPMMTSLAAFLKDMHSVNKAVTINPSHLFGQIVKQSPKFRGMQQQDCQELLRYLMDGLRNEEAKRQKSAILKYFGLSEKTDPKSVNKATRKKLKLYGRTGNHTLLDRVFSGQMVSTIVCEECHYSSQMYEPFLDLSLPVVEDKPSHKPRGGVGRLGPAVLPDDEDNVRVTCCGVQEEKRSKGQIKKDKLRKKKESRKGRKNGKIVEENEEGEGEGKNEKSVSNGGDHKKDSEKTMSNSQSAPGTLNSLVAATLTAALVPPTTATTSTTTVATSATSNSNNNTSSSTATTTSGVSSASATSDKNSNSAANNKNGFAKSQSAYTMAAGDAAKKDTSSSQQKSNNASKSGSWKDGGYDEEDEEEEGYEEGEEDGWEWEYGETWEEEGEGGGENGDENGDNGEEEDEGDDKSTYAATADESPSKPLQSLNPLPPEMINANFQHEQSAERTTGTEGEAETGASSNADVEDNDNDDNNDRHFNSNSTSGKSEKHWTAGSRRSMLINMSQLAPVQLDSMNLDPRMEALCKGIKLLTTEDNGGEGAEEGDGGRCEVSDGEGEEHEDKMARLRNEWTARTLISLAPRYETSSGECSVYSCLNQFTQSELLTGSNKWVCDNCTKNRKKREDNEEDNKKPVYTNASKQFLIFFPPMVLTLHLKRFQQTLVGCRKLNKHVVFPLVLDLAPFCSSTSLAMSHMKLNQNKVLYSLYGVVEHSGRLQGGHYTAYVKVRPANTTSRDISTFFSPPLSRTSDIPRFLRDLQKKFQDWSDLEAASEAGAEDKTSIPKRWFHISDTNVSEVSEDKVLRSQAYLLFYERLL